VARRLPVADNLDGSRSTAEIADEIVGWGKAAGDVYLSDEEHSTGGAAFGPEVGERRRASMGGGFPHPPTHPQKPKKTEHTPKTKKHTTTQKKNNKKKKNNKNKKKKKHKKKQNQRGEQKTPTPPHTPHPTQAMRGENCSRLRFWNPTEVAGRDCRKRQPGIAARWLAGTSPGAKTGAVKGFAAREFASVMLGVRSSRQGAWPR